MNEDYEIQFKNENKTTTKLLLPKICIILESEDVKDFEAKMNKYLYDGYEIETSSCNSKHYKAILVKLSKRYEGLQFN